MSSWRQERFQEKFVKSKNGILTQLLRSVLNHLRRCWGRLFWVSRTFHKRIISNLQNLLHQRMQLQANPSIKSKAFRKIRWKILNAPLYCFIRILIVTWATYLCKKNESHQFWRCCGGHDIIYSNIYSHKSIQHPCSRFQLNLISVYFTKCIIEGFYFHRC